MEQWLTELFSSHGAAILYILTSAALILAGVGLPIPEEAIFLAAGYAGHSIGVDIWVLCAVGLGGIMVGDSLPYMLGRHYGLSLLKKWPFRKLLSEKHLIHTREFFEKHGTRTVFVARFVAGLRMPTFFLAGAMGLKFRYFFLYDFVGALISCPTSIWLAYFIGPEVEGWLRKGHVVVYIALGLIILGFVVFRLIRRRQKKTPEAIKTALPGVLSAVSATGKEANVATLPIVSGKLPE